MSGHAASLRSARLQNLLRYLEARGDHGATTYEICRDLMTTNPGRDISELNLNFRRLGDPRVVVCDYVGATESGRRVHRFRLDRVRQEAAAA